MDLDEYLWRNKKKMNKLAKDLELSQASISSIKGKRTSPSLLTALKLLHISKGKIDLERLLTKEQTEHYEKWKKGLIKKVESPLPKSWQKATDPSELEKLNDDPEFQKFKENYSQILS